MQRRKTFASRGEEIGLKAESQPRGTFSRARDGAGDTGNPSSCARSAIGSASGKRSPFNARFTVTAGCKVNHPLAGFGHEGNEIKLAANNATDTPAERTNRDMRIGRSPKHRHDPPCPKYASQSATRDQQRARAGAVPSGAETHRVVMTTLHTCVMTSPQARQSRSSRNKQQGRGLSFGPAILPPSPVLGRPLGRSRWTDRLRPNSPITRRRAWPWPFEERHRFARLCAGDRRSSKETEDGWHQLGAGP